MIALIKGTVEEKKSKYLVIMTVSGVGYRIGVKPYLWSKVKIKEEIQLHIYSHIKEDAFDLYGFEKSEELELFELLLSVSGVGPKTALTAISSGSIEEILQAITKGDVAFFTQTPGIGTKGAQRIIVELRSKVGSVGEFDLSDEGDLENKEIVEALKGFGFKEKEARSALKGLPKDGGLTIEGKIKWALKSLSR